MFNFTTQTIFNTIKKGTATKGTKLDKDVNVVVGGSDLNPEVRFGNIRFNKADVLDIQKKNHTPENLAKVEFDIAKAIELVTGINEDSAEDAVAKDTQDGSYRIALYLGLNMSSQDSFYANDFVYKGKPLYIEFPIKADDEAADVATRIVKIANKYMLFMTEEKILDITADQGKVTIEGVNGYQVIKKAVLQKYDPDAKKIDCCSTNGDYVDIITGVPVTYTVGNNGTVTVGTQTLDSDGLRDLADNEVAIEPGIEAFGDYNWIIHNLRLPTAANTGFWAPTKREMPVVGGEYVQFIVRMCKERDGIAGEVVGQRATSVTTHVLYVLDQGSNVSNVQTELAKLVTAIKTDADTALATPFAGAN